MSAIECLRDCCAQRGTPRVIDDHCCPGERLQREPMQPDRAAECEDREEPAGDAKHAREAS
jgi:hypothetical protein